MADPRVSIVMLTFNRPQYIGRAIESVCRQTLQDWELLVVHDGPNEEIGRVVTEWARREPRVRYLRRTQPGNIADASNYAIARARGAYIAVLDDDDYWCLDEKLALQTSLLDEHPEIVACGGGVITIDRHGNETMRYLKPQDAAAIRRVALLANPMAHGSTMYRREAAERVGGYDAGLDGFQDWDLFLKLGQVGDLWNFQKYFLAYQIWEGGGSFVAQRKNTASALRIVRRHGASYPRRSLALLVALAYHAYGYAPAGVRKATFAVLSRAKKRLFGASA